MPDENLADYPEDERHYGPSGQVLDLDHVLVHGQEGSKCPFPCLYHGDGLPEVGLTPDAYGHWRELRRPDTLSRCTADNLHTRSCLMSLSLGHRQNFDTLRRAMLAGDAALMECQLAATGEPVAVICAANRLADDGVEFAPFAMLFSGNPYEAVNPPNPDGGFYSQEEVHV